MKIAIIDNDHLIWGIGNDQHEAFVDAYKWLNQDKQWESYEEFTGSKYFDGLMMRDITDTAAQRIEECGGDIQRSCNQLVEIDGVFMTKDEYKAKYGEEYD